MNTRERQGTRERPSIACARTQQGVAAGRGNDDCPFSNKPILHRRPFKPPTQNSLDPNDLAKMTISKQTRGLPMPQEHYLNSRGATGSHHRRTDSHRKANGEGHTTRAIQVKKLLVGEKLWRVEEQIRQKMLSNEAAAANGDIRDESRRRGGGQSRLDKAPANRDHSIQERRHLGDGQLQWRRQGQQEDAKARDEEEGEEEEEERWRRGEAAERNFMGSRQRQASRKRNESRSEDTRDPGAWGETRLRAQERREASFVGREQSSFPGCRKRNKEDVYSPYERQDTPQRHRPVDRLPMENHRGEEHDVEDDSPLPPMSDLSLYSRPQREELELAEDSDVRLFPCSVCEKTFLRERLHTHEKICKKVKVGRKRRPQFVSATQRVYTGGDPSPL